MEYSNDMFTGCESLKGNKKKYSDDNTDACMANTSDEGYLKYKKGEYASL